MDRSRMSPESSSSSSDSSPSPRSRDALNDDDDIKHEMGVSLEQTAESKKQSKKRQKRSCKPCQVAHACCDNQLPCSRCERLGRGHLCYYTAPKRRGRKRKHDEESSSPPVDPLVLIQNPEVPLRTLLQRVLVEMLEMKNKQARLEDHMMTLLTHTTSSQAADHRHQQRRQRQQQHRQHQQTGPDADEAHLHLDQQHQQYGGTSSGGEESALSASLLASLLGGVGASMSAPDLTLDHRAQLYRDSDGVTTPTTAAAAEALMAAAASTPANGAMHDPSYLQRVLRVRCAQHSQPCVVLSFTAQDPLTPPTILCCNESFEQTVGFTFTEMRGRPYLELVLPAARELTHAELCRLWQTPSQSDLEIRGLLRLLAKHQDSVELSTTLLVCFDQHGLPAACLAVGVERESSSGSALSSSSSSSSSSSNNSSSSSSSSSSSVGSGVGSGISASASTSTSSSSTLANVQTHAFSETVEEERRHHELVLAQLEQQRLARRIAVPTKDALVKLRLRELGEPICLFGEQAPDRRSRLRTLLAERALSSGVTADQVQAAGALIVDTTAGQTSTESSGSTADDEERLFYTEGSAALKEARLALLHFSLPRAAARIHAQKRRRVELVAKRARLRGADKNEEDDQDVDAGEDEGTAAMRTGGNDDDDDDEPEDGSEANDGDVEMTGLTAKQRKQEEARKEATRTRRLLELAGGASSGSSAAEPGATVGAEDDDMAEEVAEEKALRAGLAKLYNSCTQADERPLSGCVFSPNADLLASSSWSGTCRVWNGHDLTRVHTLRGHRMRANAIVWHPSAQTMERGDGDGTGGNGTVQLASCSSDQNVLLWSLQSELPLATLEGHRDRVNRLAMHPSGRYLVSTSHDLTWRLWDLETQQELLQQEGHSKATFGVALQCDGSLCVTTGLDGFGRVWDLRSGKSVWSLKGHVKEVLAVDFAPDGHTMATGSHDHTVRLWDLRCRRYMYTIPAHSSLISQLCFEPVHGRFLATASYDRTAKLFSTVDYTLLHSLRGHDNKVTSIHLSADSKRIVTASFDRTIKLWTQDDLSDLLS